MMIDNETKRSVIENYINAYNNFDVEKMLKNLDDKIVFQNISNGTVNLTTRGIDEFRNQAEQAVNLFNQREQKITDWKFGAAQTEISISYHATLAVDLPNGLKAGDKLELNGKSIFRFAGNKIIEIEDIS